MPSNIAFSTHWNSSRNKVSSSLMGVYYLLSSPYVIYAALPSWINSCLTTHFRSVFPKLNYFLRVINSWSGCTRHVNNRFRKIYLIPWGKRDVPKAPGSSLTFAGSSFISDFHLILSFGKREAPGTKLELKKKGAEKKIQNEWQAMRKGKFWFFCSLGADSVSKGFRGGKGPWGDKKLRGWEWNPVGENLNFPFSLQEKQERNAF